MNAPDLTLSLLRVVHGTRHLLGGTMHDTADMGREKRRASPSCGAPSSIRGSAVRACGWAAWWRAIACFGQPSNRSAPSPGHRLRLPPLSMRWHSARRFGAETKKRCSYSGAPRLCSSSGPPHGPRSNRDGARRGRSVGGQTWRIIPIGEHCSEFGTLFGDRPADGMHFHLPRRPLSPNYNQPCVEVRTRRPPGAAVVSS